MNMGDAASQTRDFAWFSTHQKQMRNIAVSSYDVGHFHVVEESQHRIDSIYQRELKGLEFDGNLQIEFLSVLAESLDVVYSDPPLLRGRNYFLLPDVFAQHQQQIVASEL